MTRVWTLRIVALVALTVAGIGIATQAKATICNTTCNTINGYQYCNTYCF